jgi:hypothetical protein
MSLSLIVAIILAVAGGAPASQPATRPATRPDSPAATRWVPAIKDMTPPGPLGFALYRIFMYNVPKDYAAMERDMVIELYDADMKSIGKFHRGDTLPKPFQDWRIVGIPLQVADHTGFYPPRIVITNMRTKQTVEMKQSRLATAMPTLEDYPEPGSLGFAVYHIDLDYVPSKSGAIEGRPFAKLYGADHKPLGTVRQGDSLPKPFDDWQVVAIPYTGSGQASVTITNIKTKQTMELQETRPE